MQFSNDTASIFAGFFQNRQMYPFVEKLFNNLMEGSICLRLTEAQQKTVSTNEFTGTNQDLQKPFVLHNNNLYIQRYFKYETTVLEKIKSLLHAGDALTEERIDFLKQHPGLVKNLFTELNTGEADYQLYAALNAFLHHFSIITGGPGTGKTTTVAKIIALIFEENPASKIVLAAPTGKAAARMGESLRNSSAILPEKYKPILQSIVPSTIHRLLGYKHKSIYFKYNAHNPLPVDVVVIDESSMIDVALFSKLIEAVPDSARIILLGDKSQLSSVEAGSIFGDMCNSLHASNNFTPASKAIIEHTTGNTPEVCHSNNILCGHITELRKSHRFSDDRGIGKLSKAVLNNDTSSLESFIHNHETEDIVFDKHFSRELFDKFINGYESYIDEPDLKTAFQKINNLRVLCAVRKGETGLYQTNHYIETYLHRKGKIKPGEIFYHNKPVMLTKNYPDLGVFNGEVGIIRKDDEGTMYTWFLTAEGELKKFLPAYFTDAETAFAMTIHKSQGSEFDEVLLRLPSQTESNLLSRELIYTGITRAKKRVIIQSTPEIFLTAAANQAQRASGIAERLNSP